MNQIYLETARLLIQVAPIVFNDGIFALKGGTAINLFYRDMPRLSVDLDLVFVNYRLSRNEALTSIGDALRKASDRLAQYGFQTHITSVQNVGETKLFVRRGNIEVKVEVNFVMRGTINSIVSIGLTQKAKDTLLADLELPVVSIEDVYGGKLVAALDRQHPRDLFDVCQLLENEGITPEIRKAFVAYLACHNRPIHEVLFPRFKDIEQEFQSSFLGMTATPVELNNLLAARERVARELQSGLTTPERDFLVSLAHAEPNWLLLDISHLESLPAIRWKLQNLRDFSKKNPAKLKAQAKNLERLLSG